MKTQISISIDSNDLNVLNNYIKNGSLNRSNFIVKTVLEKINNQRIKKK